MPRYQKRDWNTELILKGQEVGFEVIRWDGEPTKRNKVLIRCKHKEQWVFPHGQLSKTFCCKSSSKQGINNPNFETPTWNTGTTGISTGCGFGRKPRGEQRNLPGILYLVEYEDQSGTHLKVGITSKSIRERLKGKLKRVIHSLEMSLGECFDLEQKILKDLDEFRYSSQSTTELFTTEALPLILNYLNQ